MDTASKSFKIGFSDYFDQSPPDAAGVDSATEYMAGYQDAIEQDELAFRGSNDHA